MLKHLLRAMAIVLFLAVSARGADRLVPSVYPTIQQAINAADNNDVVIIANGVYSGTGNREIDFLGKAITVRSVNGPGNCVVDCNYAGRGFYFHNSETSATVLEGIAIKNTSNFAAIDCINASPTINNCVITGYFGISCSGGSPAIIACTISSCYNQSGLSINNCSDVNVANCTITNNFSYYNGGAGINGYNSTASISGCIIKFNNANGQGGGILWQGGSATIRNCEISGNTAHGPDGYDNWINPCPPDMPPCPSCFTIPAGYGVGGGICSQGSSLELQNCIISGNRASGGNYWGGGCSGGNPTMGGSGAGGGIFCTGNALEIKNCLISENQATGGQGMPGGGGSGGGIYCSWETTLTIQNCIISNNSAVQGPGCWECSSGGGIDYYGGGAAIIENSIIWGNHVDTDGSGPEIFGDTAGINVTYSDIGPEIWTGSMDADPLFVSGPLGDYYLSNVAAGQTGNSPCINAGDYLANKYGLDAFTTSTDNFPDLGQVDMGYHYEISEQPNLVLSDPNGGETFIAGKTHSVLWQSQGAVRDVRIEYSTDNGSYWQEVYPPNYGHTGSYQWLVPAVDSNHCLMRITDRNLSNAADTSNGTFTIFRCQLKGDLNGDCHVDFEDFAILSSEWLNCGNPFDSGWCNR